MRKENRKWTVQETEELVKMVELGYCWEDIGKKLNRTGSCARGKYERILNPDYQKRRYRNHKETSAYEKPEWVSIHLKKKST